MSTPDSNNQPSKMKQLLNGGSEESPMNRLPRSASAGKAPAKTASIPKQAAVKKTEKAAKPAQPKRERKPINFDRSKIMPTFWTIASTISMLVNVVVVIALIVVVQLLGGTKSALAFAQGQANGLLGGLYNNFVKMDAASIKTTIHVEKDIPVQFSLNVSGSTNVTLSDDVSIRGALVTVNTGGLNINNARANIVLPAGTVLPIFIENLVVPVDKTVPAILDVPVNIPLNATELHEPFVGLQEVVEPYYCLLQPDIVVNGERVCDTAVPILPVSQ